jgi:hypothetical protein
MDRCRPWRWPSGSEPLPDAAWPCVHSIPLLICFGFILQSLRELYWVVPPIHSYYDSHGFTLWIYPSSIRICWDMVVELSFDLLLQECGECAARRAMMDRDERLCRPLDALEATHGRWWTPTWPPGRPGRDAVGHNFLLRKGRLFCGCIQVNKKRTRPMDQGPPRIGCIIKVDSMNIS